MASVLTKSDITKSDITKKVKAVLMRLFSIVSVLMQLLFVKKKISD